MIKLQIILINKTKVFVLTQDDQMEKNHASRGFLQLHVETRRSINLNIHPVTGPALRSPGARPAVLYTPRASHPATRGAGARLPSKHTHQCSSYRIARVICEFYQLIIFIFYVKIIDNKYI